VGADRAQDVTSLSGLERSSPGGRKPRNFLVIYVSLATWIAVLILATTARVLPTARPGDFVLLAALAAAAPSIFGPLAIHGRRSPISFAMLITGVLLFGGEAGAWLAAVSGAAAVGSNGPRRPLYVFFGAASYVISAFLAGSALGLYGAAPGDIVGNPAASVVAIVVAIAALALLRSIALLWSSPALTFAQSAGEGRRFLPSYVAMAGFGLGLALLYQAVGPVGLLVFLVPAALAGQSFWRYTAKADEVRGKNALLEQRIGELEAINQISSHFASMHTLEHTLQLASVAATKLASFRLAFVLVYDEAQARFVPGAVSGADNALFEQVSEQLCELAPATLGNGQPVVITGERYALYTHALSALGLAVNSLLLTPIMRGDQLIGVLGAACAEAPGPDRRRFMSILAAQTALAIDNASLYSRMKQMAVTDYVTGLHNHRFFQECLEAELERCTATNRSVALMMLDVDFFKDFNDRFGHPAGDELLRQVAGRITSALRRSDVVCRYGGDEFAVVLPESDEVQAKAVAERIRHSIAGGPFRWTGTDGAAKEARLTASLGLALSGAGQQAKQELIGAADRALQRAKETGRDKLVVARVRSAASDSGDTGALAGTIPGGVSRWSTTASKE
jgi:diguanylate cyclase (GGDEF)-like protein